jgi:hypothetical protein
MREAHVNARIGKGCYSFVLFGDLGDLRVHSQQGNSCFPEDLFLEFLAGAWLTTAAGMRQLQLLSFYANRCLDERDGLNDEPEQTFCDKGG